MKAVKMVEQIFVCDLGVKLKRLSQASPCGFSTAQNWLFFFFLEIESVLFITMITARREEIAQGMTSKDREDELGPNSGVYLSTTSRLFMRQG